MTPGRGGSAETSFATTMGLAKLARMIYHGVDRKPVVSSLTSRVNADSRDAAALMDLSMIAQLTGDRELGLAIQSRALEVTRIFRCIHGTGEGLRLLALFTPGDFMANTPLDFLLDGSDVSVYYVYTTAGTPLPPELPDHDVAFVGVAESDANKALLGELAGVASSWPHPVINRRARAIAELTRDQTWELFESSHDVAAPRNVRVNRRDLLRVTDGSTSLGELLSLEFPVIVRPLDSHAGQGLAKIDNAPGLQSYVVGSDADVFYMAPYIDYRSADGQFRKYRIVFIAGRAYIVHLAISDNWMVHYLNAGMHESVEKRGEEAECMESFDEGFCVRHGAAFEQLVTRIGLDYFAVDCAETRDGSVLLFEVGTGMIVHAMDLGDIFPYKQIQMKKIFTAFLGMLGAAAERGNASRVEAARA
ncbi:MAG TPA: hypothetical protein VII66_10335 [Gemmatimonadaceae bacterium]